MAFAVLDGAASFGTAATLAPEQLVGSDGDLIIAWAASSANASVTPTHAINGGSAWTLIGSAVITTGVTRSRITAWFARQGDGHSAPTITFTPTGATACHHMACTQRITGVLGTNPPYEGMNTYSSAATPNATVTRGATAAGRLSIIAAHHADNVATGVTENHADAYVTDYATDNATGINGFTYIGSFATIDDNESVGINFTSGGTGVGISAIAFALLPAVVTLDLSGAAAASFGAAGQLEVDRFLLGEAAVAFGAAGGPVVEHDLDGVAAMSFGAAGSPDVETADLALDGAPAVTFATAGELEVDQLLSGEAAFQFALAGGPVVEHLLAGASAFQFGAAGELEVDQLLSGVAAMQFAAAGSPLATGFVNSTSGISAGAGTTVALTAFNCVAGNTIAVGIGTYATGSVVSTVTDTAGNTYTKAAESKVRTSNEVWVATDITGHATNVITVTFSASVSTTRRAIAHQYSGRATTNVVDGTGVGNGTGVTSCTTGSFSPAAAGGAVFAYLVTQGADSAQVAGANYVLRLTEVADSCSEDRVDAPSGAQTCSISWTGSSSADLVAVNLKLPDAGAVNLDLTGSPALTFGVAGNPVLEHELSGTVGFGFEALERDWPVVEADVFLSGAAGLQFAAAGDLMIDVPMVLTWVLSASGWGGGAMAPKGWNHPWPQPGNWKVEHWPFGQSRLVFGASGNPTVEEFEHALAGAPGLLFGASGTLENVPAAERLLSGAPGIIFGVDGTLVNEQTKFISGAPAILIRGAGSPTAEASGGFAAQYVLGVTGGGAMPNWSGSVINVASYGAVGNGSTDDTTAIQNALNAGRSQAKPVVFPWTANFYRTTTRLTVGTSIAGIGGRAVIKNTSGSPDYVPGGVMILDAGFNGWIYNLQLEGTFVATRQTEHGHLVYVQATPGITIKNCIFKNPKGDCIDVLARWGGGTTQANNGIIDGCEFYNPMRCAIAFEWNADRWNVLNNYFDKPFNYVTAIDMENFGGPSGSLVTNIEIGHNNFLMNNSPKVAGYGTDGWCVAQYGFNGTAGYNIWVHNNHGFWYWGFYYKGPYYTNWFDINNTQG